MWTVDAVRGLLVAPSPSPSARPRLDPAAARAGLRADHAPDPLRQRLHGPAAVPGGPRGARQRQRPADDRAADRGRSDGRPAGAAAAGAGGGHAVRGRRGTYLLAAAARRLAADTAARARAAPGRQHPAPEIAEGCAPCGATGPCAGCAPTALCNIGMGALIATLVLHVTGWLDAGTAGYAAATTAYAVGSWPGEWWPADRRVARPRTARCCSRSPCRPAPWSLMGTCGAWPPSRRPWPCSGSWAWCGTSTETTLMQQRSPADMLGRVSSAFRTLVVAGAPPAPCSAGPSATAWGLNTPRCSRPPSSSVGIALIRAVKPDVPVVAPQDDGTTAAPRADQLGWNRPPGR
jgi:hypothetical protein